MYEIDAPNFGQAVANDLAKAAQFINVAERYGAPIRLRRTADGAHGVVVIDGLVKWFDAYGYWVADEQYNAGV